MAIISQLTGPNGNPRFDRITSTTTVQVSAVANSTLPIVALRTAHCDTPQTLVVKMTAAGVQSYIDQLLSVFNEGKVRIQIAIIWLHVMKSCCLAWISLNPHFAVAGER